MVYEYRDYRSYLRATLEERSKKNPNFSLRAFAKRLGVSPSMLSLVQSGKRNFTPSHAMKIAKKLELNSREAQYFSLLVQLETAKTPEAVQAVRQHIAELNPERHVQSLELDNFAAIAEWYHFPILQLLNIKKFKFTSANIAKRLEITVTEANDAIARLMRLGYIVQKDGVYQRAAPQLRAESKSRNDAIRLFHKQMLQKAIVSLDEQTTNEKYVGTETIAIDVKRLPIVKAMIDDFFDQVNAVLEQGEEPTEVYHFGIQFFRVTRKV